MSRNFIKSVLDGSIQVAGIVLICILYTSKVTSIFPLEYLLIASVCIAMISAGLYFSLLFKEPSNKIIIGISFGSICCSVICGIMLLAFQLTFNFQHFATRELNNADGIVILLSAGIYLVSSFILRICVFAGLLIKNWNQGKSNRG